MMKNRLSLALLLVAAVASCSESPESSFARKVDDFALVTIQAPDLSGITDNGKEVLNLYRHAADEVNAIYWEQYFGDRQALLDRMEDPFQQAFAEINYGPWDRTTGKSFVEEYGDRPAGAGFYPADMTVEEFEAWDHPEKNSPYTLVRRAADGSLETVWYHDAYKAHIDWIINYLNVAADITDKPSVRDYLLCQAHALKTDNYYVSSLSWLDMDDSKMDLVIGPNEVTDDQLLGIKRSYEAFILLKNQAETEELMNYVSRISELLEDLPGDPAYKSFQPGTGSNIFSCDALYYAGKANAGVKVITLNLPFDADVRRDRGTRTILLQNVINAKYNTIVAPTGKRLLDAENAEQLSANAFFWNIVFREVAHGLGVKETVNGRGSVEQALGSVATTFEELKTDAAGALLVCKLQDHFNIHDHDYSKDGALTAFFASLFRPECLGEASSFSLSSVIIYNYLREAGALQRNRSGHYTLNLKTMEDALSDLTAFVLKTQATGDREGAMAFENQYSKRCDDYIDDLANLRSEKIPVDLRFEFKR